MNHAYDVLVDARDEDCPIPTIRTKEALDAMPPGAVLKLVTGKEGTLRNIRVFASNNPCEVLSEIRDADGFVFYIRKLPEQSK